MNILPGKSLLTSLTCIKSKFSQELPTSVAIFSRACLSGLAWITIFLFSTELSKLEGCAKDFTLLCLNVFYWERSSLGRRIWIPVKVSFKTLFKGLYGFLFKSNIPFLVRLPRCKLCLDFGSLPALACKPIEMTRYILLELA